MLYKSVKHAYARYVNGEIVITIPTRAKHDTRLYDAIFAKAEKLWKKVSAREYVSSSTVLGDDLWNILDVSLQDALLLDIARPLCDIYALQLWKPYHSLRCKNLRSKWWYCTHDNHIVLSRKLIHMPYEVIKYVVVHEIVHLVHKHHQKSFWFTVATLYPQYTQMRKYLRSIVVD